MTHDTTDLTNYYTGSQIDTKLNDYLSKTDASNNYYSKSEVDTKLTAASQNGSSGVFIGELIKFISSSDASTMQSYTTTENCIAIFNVNKNSDNANYTIQIRDANGKYVLGATENVPYYLSPNKMVQVCGAHIYDNSSGRYISSTAVCYIFKPA